MDKLSAVETRLESILAKADKADWNLKFDVMHSGVSRLLRELRPIPPIEDWRNGHYGEKEETKAG